jgi:hypothetical protein
MAATQLHDSWGDKDDEDLLGTKTKSVTSFSACAVELSNDDEEDFFKPYLE